MSIRALSPEWKAAVAPAYAHRQVRIARKLRNRERWLTVLRLLVALFVVWLWCQPVHRSHRRAHRIQPVTLTTCPDALALLSASGSFFA